MAIRAVFTFICLVFCSLLRAQVSGCTDPKANNYNPLAEQNDGSCQYAQSSAAVYSVCPKLNDTLKEISGMIHFNGHFWALNDGGNPPCLYAFDSSSGKVLKTVWIRAGNRDWEDLTQDADFLYIGDFGNNAGNRKDLSILKIRKSDIRPGTETDSVDAGLIRFSLGDQTDFTPAAQDHDYDMEALCFFNDSLHLFSKNWKDGQSRHYICASDTGTYILYPLETLNTGGMITGACSDGQNQMIFCGYNRQTYQTFLWLCWDFRNSRLLSGNRRRIDCGNLISPGQTEAVCLWGDALYISNEKQISEAGLHRTNTGRWTGIRNGSPIRAESMAAAVHLYYNRGQLHIEHRGKMMGKTIQIFDSQGRMLIRFVSGTEDWVSEPGLSADHCLFVFADGVFLDKIMLY